MVELSDDVFYTVRDIIYHQAGIHLTERKRALVTARLSKRLRFLGFSDYGKYLDYVISDQSGTELAELIDAIATNVTSFFREREHFCLMDSFYRAWYDEGQRRFRLWSAACSTGEEPYSMAITLQESGRLQGADVKILATDISSKVMRIAKEGVYSAGKLETVSQPVLNAYFRKTGTKKDVEEYQVQQVLKDMILYRRLNLAAPPFKLKGPLDMIFCRNVMIYFERRTRCRLVEEFGRLLRPGGYLFVGHAESLTGLGVKSLKPFGVSVYKKA